MYVHSARGISADIGDPSFADVNFVTLGRNWTAFPYTNLGTDIGFISDWDIFGTDIGFSPDWGVIVSDSGFFFMWVGS